MKGIRAIVTYAVITLMGLSLHGQTIHPFSLKNDFQYGVSAKMQVVLNDNRTKHGKNHIPTLRCGLNAGAGVLLNLDALRCKMLPAYHVELLLYYNGIGSGRISKANIDINSSLTNTIGGENKQDELAYFRRQPMNAPLYFFSNNAAPPLINPFSHSITLGFNYIIPTTKYKFSQRLAYVGFKIDKFQLGYFNDGGKGMNKIGDRKDRNYTGGLLFAYGFRKNVFLDNIELTYLKYTGYNKNTFEILSKLSFGYTDYVDPDQEDFNRSKWSLNVQGADNQFAFNVDANNSTKLDLQHLIHKIVFDPYHIVKRLPSLAYGFSYQVQTQHYFK